MKTGITRVLSLLFIFLFAACSSTRITSSWVAPATTPRQFDKIMVVALIKDPDRRMREEMEQRIAGELKNAGVNAFCSCEEFGPKTFEDLSEKDVLGRLKNAGVDGVLSVVLLDKTREKYYVPGRVYYTPFVVYHRRFWGYYNTIYGRIYSPGYYQVNTRYFWESNLYDLRRSENELLYSAQTQSFDPGSVSSLALEYSGLIVGDLLKKQVISKGPAGF